MRLPVQLLAETYKDHLYAAAFSVCRNQQDAEDAVQDTFLAYFSCRREFDNEEHIRAWLIRVAINKAKNSVLTFWHRNKVPLEEYMETLTFETEQDGELFQAVMKLPAKYRIVIHLFYEEDYSVKEIADILHRSANTVKSQLYRGRELLKASLKEEWEDEAEE